MVRKGVSIKKQVLIIVCLLTAFRLLLGCQPTPEEPIDVNMKRQQNVILPLS
jgi:hypothetical protein